MPKSRKCRTATTRPTDVQDKERIARIMREENAYGQRVEKENRGKVDGIRRVEEAEA